MNEDLFDIYRHVLKEGYSIEIIGTHADWIDIKISKSSKHSNDVGVEMFNYYTLWADGIIKNSDTMKPSMMSRRINANRVPYIQWKIK